MIEEKTGTLNKFVKASVVAGTLAVFLAGCGTSSGTSPKDTYSKAFNEIQDAKTLESQTKVSLEAKMDKEADATDKQALDLLNSIKLDIGAKSDTKTDQHELDIAVGGSMGAVSLDLKLPMFIDGVAQKAYIKSEGYTEIMSTVMMTFGMPVESETPESIKGKVIELSSDENSVGDTKKQEKALQDLLNESRAFVADIPEDNFAKDGDKITYKVDGQKAVTALFDAFEKNPELLEGLDSPGDIKEMRDAFTETVKLGEVKVIATLNGGSLAHEVMLIPATITNPDGEDVQLTLSIANEYKSVNKKLDFTFDVSDDNVITQEAYDKAMGSPTTLPIMPDEQMYETQVE